MNVQVQGHPWSSESLYSKSILYVGKMQAAQVDDPDFGLWSSLSLEFLARAALSSISPVLLADSHSWRNVHYALGMEVTKSGFSPSSIGIKEVFARINELRPSFTAEILGYCSQHIERRNVELHTGEMAFTSLNSSVWLSKYYKSCDILLNIMSRNLEDFFELPESVKSAIESLNDETGKSVRQDINAYKKVWNDKSDEEKENSKGQAAIWSTRQSGHRITCPACNSTALLQGTAASVVKTITNDENDEVIQKQSMLPSAFECVACGLKINGYSKLNACGLGDAFTKTTTYTIPEFYNLYTEDDIEEARREGEAAATTQYEEDFND
ncbi:hypothetical protein [Rahnella aceris]